MYSNELKLHRNKTSRAKLAHQSNLKEKGIMCKFDHELMFPSNLKELGQQYFNEGKVNSDDLARYLFCESCTHARTTRLSGKNISYFNCDHMLLLFYQRYFIAKQNIYFLFMIYYILVQVFSCLYKDVYHVK